jgi:hypothetical protein
VTLAHHDADGQRHVGVGDVARDAEAIVALEFSLVDDLARIRAGKLIAEGTAGTC